MSGYTNGMKVGVALFLLLTLTPLFAEQNTEILNWPGGKRAAISITYDDGTENQFKIALPMMQRLGFPATFFIITGEVRGSTHQPPQRKIESFPSTPTNEKNFIERSSALYAGGYIDNHTKIGEAYEDGKLQEAYRLVDRAYSEIRKGTLKPTNEKFASGPMSWNDFRKFAALGFEFASHTISHPYLSVLNDADLKYELKGSRDEIQEQLGENHVFSVECPFGTEDERAVQAALKIYALARNLMPDPQVQDLNRWDEQDPRTSKKSYVRWQRGALSNTPLETMEKWVDTSRESSNIWLVLVIHGVDGVGWEPLSSTTLEAYFRYMKAHESELWIATFQDAGKYIREKLAAQVATKTTDHSIEITLTELYDPLFTTLPLTLKTTVPASWKRVKVEQKGSAILRDATDGSVLYEAIPNAGLVVLTPQTEN